MPKKQKQKKMDKQSDRKISLFCPSLHMFKGGGESL
jgi:hypothetical protein